MIRTIFALFICAGLLTGCKSMPSNLHTKKIIAHRDTEYLHAEALPPLKIPAGMSMAPMEETYPTPSEASPASTHALSLVPPGLNPA